jgi:hypothetical protein
MGPAGTRTAAVVPDQGVWAWICTVPCRTWLACNASGWGPDLWNSTAACRCAVLTPMHPVPCMCCAVMPLPGLLACVLLLSAVAIMESFWRRFLPGQNTWTAARAAQRKAAEQEDTIAQASFPSAWSCSTILQCFACFHTKLLATVREQLLP